MAIGAGRDSDRVPREMPLLFGLDVVALVGPFSGMPENPVAPIVVEPASLHDVRMAVESVGAGMLAPIGVFSGTSPYPVRPVSTEPASLHDARAAADSMPWIMVRLLFFKQI
jgi:hypothetical protein